MSSIVQRLRAAGCVFAEEEAAQLIAAAQTPAELETLVSRRTLGEPLELVVGWADFCGLRIAVAPGVFVPRLRTELLVREAADLAQAGSTVVDLCCGTGALGAAVQAVVPGISLSAADVDPSAVACARTNLDAPVYEGDLFEALPTALRGTIDVLLCNTPYVPTDEIALLPGEARDHEHRVALDGGPDGLTLQRRVADQAGQWLAPGGHLLVEVSERQAAAALAIFAATGLVARLVQDEELGATVVVASRPAPRDRQV